MPRNKFPTDTSDCGRKNGTRRPTGGEEADQPHANQLTLYRSTIVYCISFYDRMPLKIGRPSQDRPGRNSAPTSFTQQGRLGNITAAVVVMFRELPQGKHTMTVSLVNADYKELGAKAQLEIDIPSSRDVAPDFWTRKLAGPAFSASAKSGPQRNSNLPHPPEP